MLTALLTVGLATAPAELSYDLRVDGPVTAALGAWWVLSEAVFKKQLAPATCRWCARNGLDDAVRVLRASPQDVKAVRITSDLFGIAGVPLTMLAADALFTWRGDGTWRDALVDALLIVEAMVASQALNQAVKFAAGRERPFVAQLSPAEKALTDEPADNDLSFFSGHTSYAFSLVAATATVLRARGYRHWWAVLVAGAPLAVTTAVLRIVGDKHYFTDVVTGAAIGTLFGVGIPALFHRPVQAGPVTAELSAGPSGFAVTGRW